MVYDIYHDESKQESYWHVFLFVPRDTRADLLRYLVEARHLNSYNGDRLNFKNLRSNSSFSCAKSWISILAAALQQVEKGQLEPFILGRVRANRNPSSICGVFERFSTPPKCKIGVFHLENGLRDMSVFLDGLSKIETTFRMGLQGAAHYLFSESEPLEIGKIFLDREVHYRIEYRREFDKSKILNRLSTNFRQYCSLHPDCEIMGEGVGSDDNILLDLADVALGAIRFATLTPCQLSYEDAKQRKRVEICKMLFPLVKKLRDGHARMQNSRFVNFGTFSSAKIEDATWQFKDLSHRYLFSPAHESFGLFEAN